MEQYKLRRRSSEIDEDLGILGQRNHDVVLLGAQVLVQSERRPGPGLAILRLGVADVTREAVRRGARRPDRGLIVHPVNLGLRIV